MKESDDNGRVCTPCNNLKKKKCLKCNRNKKRSLYSGIEWNNTLSICHRCAILESNLNDNTNEEAKKHLDTNSTNVAKEVEAMVIVK